MITKLVWVLIFVSCCRVQAQSIASGELQVTKLRVSGQIEAQSAGRLIMKQPFSGDIEIVMLSDKQNKKPISFKALGHYRIDLDALGYRVDSTNPGASQCVGSTDIVLNMDVRTFKSPTSEKDQFAFTIWFSSMEQDFQAYKLLADKSILMASYARTEFSVLQTESNLLPFNGLTLISPKMKVRTQLPGCSKDLRDATASLEITKIELVP